MSKLSNNKKIRNLPEPLQREILKKMGYSIGKTIGEGTYSKVCVATACLDDISDEKVACKIIHKKYAGSEFIKKFLPRELRILRHLKHPNIVTVYNILEVHNTIYIVMEYCRNGDLLEYIREQGPLNEGQSKLFFKQIIDAVEYLHGQDVAHRDLKCENILLSGNNNVVKVGDFGFARCCVDSNGDAILSETYCGSAAYAAPEIIQGIPYDPKMYDIWALGCILYIMMSATMPFDDSNVKKMLKNQLSRSLCVSAFRSWRKHCIHLRNLIAYLLEPDVSRRATIGQISDCIWLQEPTNLKNKKSCDILDDVDNRLF